MSEPVIIIGEWQLFISCNYRFSLLIDILPVYHNLFSCLPQQNFASQMPFAGLAGSQEAHLAAAEGAESGGFLGRALLVRLVPLLGQLGGIGPKLPAPHDTLSESVAARRDHGPIGLNAGTVFIAC